MPTVNQIFRDCRKKRFRKKKSVALGACPQKKGICSRIYVRNPKKPNSALRRVARLRLFKKGMHYLTALIPGEGHSLQQYAIVLAQGSWVRDLPGVRYSLVRGAYDLKGVVGRTNGRSKYGTAKWLRSPKIVASKKN